MLKARKANRVLKIPDEKKKTYIALGYSITDMEGNMIYDSAGKSQKTSKGKSTDQASDVKTSVEEK